MLFIGTSTTIHGTSYPYFHSIREYMSKHLSLGTCLLFLQVDDRGKSPAVDQTTGSSGQLVNLNVIPHSKYFKIVIHL